MDKTDQSIEKLLSKANIRPLSENHNNAKFKQPHTANPSLELNIIKEEQNSQLYSVTNVKESKSGTIKESKSVTMFKAKDSEPLQ